MQLSFLQPILISNVLVQRNHAVMHGLVGNGPIVAEGCDENGVSENFSVKKWEINNFKI